MSSIRPFPIQTEGKEKLKLSPLLIKTSRGGNALCIFGLGYYAAFSDFDFLVRILSGCVFWAVSSLRPYVTPCFKPLADKSLVGAVLVTGLPLFSFSGPCPRTVSWGGAVAVSRVGPTVEVGTFLCLHPIW